MSMTLIQLIQALSPDFRVFYTGDIPMGPASLTWRTKTFVLYGRESGHVVLIKVEMRDLFTLGQCSIEPLREVFADPDYLRVGIGLTNCTLRFEPESLLEYLKTAITNG